MNIIKKTKLINAFIGLAKVIEKNYKDNQEKIKDVLWLFGTCFKDARPYIDKIKVILKDSK